MEPWMAPMFGPMDLFWRPVKFEKWKTIGVKPFDNSQSEQLPF